MFVTTHAATGALLARAATRAGAPLPAIAAAGWLSHYALDALPHWGFAGHELIEVSDPRFLRAAVPDGLGALTLVGLLARRAATTRDRLDVAAALAAAAAVAPDLDKPFTLVLHRSPFPGWHDRFHGRIQREDPRNLRREVVSAAALAALALVAGRRHRPPS